jgi:hypothetical protein
MWDPEIEERVSFEIQQVHPNAAHGGAGRSFPVPGKGSIQGRLYLMSRMTPASAQPGIDDLAA